MSNEKPNALSEDSSSSNLPLSYQSKSALSTKAATKWIRLAALCLCALLIITVYIRSYITQDAITYFTVSGTYFEIASDTGAIYISKVQDSQTDVLKNHVVYHKEHPAPPEETNGVIQTRLLPFKCFRIGARLPTPGVAFSGWIFFVISDWIFLVPFAFFLTSRFIRIKSQRRIKLRKEG